MLNKIIKRSLFRFIGVGILGEILYLILFAIFIYAGLSSTLAVIPSGLICILFNSFMHARISFRIRFNFTFIFQYIAIQVFCMICTYLASFILVWIGMNTFSIGFSTLIIWAILSFVLVSNIASIQKGK